MKRFSIYSRPIPFFMMIFPACALEPDPPTEQVTGKKDLVALRALPEQWDVAYHAKDLEALMQLYTQDAVRLPPEVAMQDGSEAIRDHFQWAFTEHTSEGEIVVLDARVSGDLGYIRGTYNGTSISKTDGEPLKYDERFVVVAQLRLTVPGRLSAKSGMTIHLSNSNRMCQIACCWD
jgi:uncharacterized protein (TIGR02246 family)